MRKPLVRTVILTAILMAGLAVALVYRNANKTSTDLRGLLAPIGLKQARQVVRVTFPGTTVSETLQQNKAYVVSVPDDPAAPTLTLDQAVLLSGSPTQPVNFFGYKYVSADGATETAHRTDPNFLVRFPGQFFASAQARSEDAQYGNIIAQFEASHGIAMASTSAVNMERNARYIVIVNESQPVTFNIRAQAVCGDGVIGGTEGCDDHNTTSGDGCSSTCQIESGWTCGGTPSVCQKCGNGIKEGTEQCDDGNTASGDGCSNTCSYETGWSCTGTNPAVCTPVCGDGLVRGTEGCDDHNLVNGDGCSNVCQVESGWTCTGNNPSVCTQVNADLAISAYFDPSTAQRGNTTVLHVSVTNNGPSTATNTVMPFPAPAGLTFQTYDSTTGVSCTTQTCQFGTLQSGQTKSFTLTYLINTVSPCTASASLTANVSVSSDVPDLNSSNNQSSATVTATCPPSADLSTTVTAAPQTGVEGADVTISTDVYNGGPATAANAYVSIDVGGVTEMNNLRVQTSGVSCSTTASGLTCTLGNIASGVHQPVVILATLTPHTPCTQGSTSTHYVNIYPGSDTPDGNTANDHSSVTVTGTCPVLNPDLVLTASASPSSVERGTDTVLTFHVANSGQGSAANTQLHYPVQSSVTYVSYSAPNATCTFSNNFLTCDFGTLAAGASRDVNVTVLVPTVSPCTSSQQITVSGNVSTDSSDPNTGNNYATTTITATCPVVYFSPAPYVDASGLPMSPNYSIQLTPPASVTQTSPSQSFSIPGTINAFPLPGTQYPVSFAFYLTYSSELTIGWPQPSGAISISCSQPFNFIPNIRYCAGMVFESGPKSISIPFTLPQMCIANTYQMFLIPDANPAHLQDLSRPVTCQ